MSVASGTARPEGQTFGGSSKLTRFANFVKLPHTVFALPFALVGVVLASELAPVTLPIVLHVVLAFTAARFAAMGFNRIVDRHLDAENPRTAMRELPAGALTVVEAWASVAAASAIFVWAAWRLNPLCFALSPVALAWVFFYSYCKRFTGLSHLVLGIGLAIAPVGGFLAVTGFWSEPWWMLFALVAAVASWVGGFDILYALQDLEFDRSRGLHSVPARLGVRGAIRVARAHHVVTVLALAAVGVAVGGQWLYLLGVGVVAALLLWEHRLVRGDDLSRLDAAFFTMNGVISITFFGFVLAERLLLR